MLIRYGIFILILILLFGCTEAPPDKKTYKEISIPDIKPPVKDTATSIQENISPIPNNTANTEKSPISKHLTSTAPTEARLDSFPNDNKLPNKSPNTPSSFIDRVYATDLETSKPASGRALIAGKSYELIAENEQPFVDYVRFTILADGGIVDTSEARCPESCANENMYSISFSVPRGDFKEIKMIAEDGSGAKGESVAYQYTASNEEATRITESCSVSDAIPKSQCSESTWNLVYYGSTISTGWSEAVTPHPYDLNSEYAGICDEVNSGGGLGTGFFAQTQCSFSPNFCWSLKTKIDREACTCECSAQPTDVKLPVSINIDFPNWAGYDKGSTCEQQKWDEFLQNTKTHEEGHAETCREAQKPMQEKLGRISKRAVGANCDVACDAAIERGEAATESLIKNEINDINDKQKLYDEKTRHGATQGATLDCAAC